MGGGEKYKLYGWDNPIRYYLDLAVQALFYQLSRSSQCLCAYKPNKSFSAVALSKGCAGSKGFWKVLIKIWEVIGRIVRVR